MIERRVHVVARCDDHRDWAGRSLWFVDGMGVRVSDRDFERASHYLGTKPVFLPGCRAHLELVEGRWLLAKLELP